MIEMTNDNSRHNQDDKKAKERKGGWKRNVIRSLWTLFIAGFIAMILLFALIYNGVVGYMPPVEALWSTAATAKNSAAISAIPVTESMPILTRYHKM